jgi:hypothetical protein
VTVATRPPATSQADSAADGITVGSASAAEGCPLCGTPLRVEQEWCLRCGAAARTRLAAVPRWRAPLILLCVVIVLALGVLAAALVSLAGN